jgi:hypothetical protein
MRKIAVFLGLLLAASASAAVTVNTQPTSLVTTATTLAADTEKVVFELALTADAAETLSSVVVTVNSSNAVSGDLAFVAVYKDDGDGSFDSGDSLAGSNTNVNIGSTTVVATTSNNALGGEKFFVTVKTAAGWAMPDSITVGMAASGIVTSANAPTVTTVTTAALNAPDLTAPTLQSVVAANVGATSGIDAGDTLTLTFSEATNKPAITAANIGTVLVLNNSHSWLDGVASIGGASWNAAGTMLTVTLSTGTSAPTLVVGDTVTVTGSVIQDTTGNNATGTQTITGNFGPVDTTGPLLTSAVAKNTGGTAAFEALDSVDLTFNEATNKPTINASNINTVLVLNNSHSWLDGASALGGAVWDSTGKVLTVKVSGGTSLPTLAVGDTVTVTGNVIKDAANNSATGTQTITGSFAGSTGGGEEEEHGKSCGQGIVNGRLYKIGSDATVYLAAACRLKPFRGAAVFHARGHKSQNITVLSAAPSVAPLSTDPALPAGGTLVQGTDKTVWFVTTKGKKKGFVSETSFKRLGFEFKAVKKISDSDLNTMTTETPVTENDSHPEGSIIKCGNSATVFEVKGSTRFPFTSITAFEGRGHSFEHIANVDCGRFAYPEGSNLTEQ